MVVSEESTLMAQHTRARGATFPGSGQVQSMHWSVAVHADGAAQREYESHPQTYDAYFYTTVYHSDFDPEWPVSTDWSAVVRGLRGSFDASQAAFAEMCQLGRATIERWERGQMVPFRGDPLKLLTIVRPHLVTPVQAGQALNLAAAVVLPHLRKPTAEYAGRDLVAFLAAGKHDHRYLGPGLLKALVTARILIPLQVEDDELDDTYFPLAARLRDDSTLPSWAPGLIDDVMSVDESDREMLLGLARRIARGK
jgi:transcriptional regulator with XRE-family HTH domain